jgi:hypothetical protein
MEVKMKKFKSYDELDEAAARTKHWSGKPLPKNASDISFSLTDTQYNKPKILASIPGFTNEKGKSIVNGIGWEKEEDAKIQQKIYQMIVDFLNTPESKKKINSFLTSNKFGL